MQQATDGNRIGIYGDPTPVVVKPLVVVESPVELTPLTRPRWKTLLPAVAVGACVLAGVGLRVTAFAQNRSFWIDEAMLALNVVHRTPAELLRPLDLNQGAPVGYLMVSKMMSRAFGSTEPVLRASALVAALAGMAVFVPLAYRLFPVPAARVAVGLFCLSPYLIAYSAEFKQYELDATLAIVLTAVGLPVWRSTAGPWRLAGFAAAGAASVWFSHPAAFVLGGVGLACLADAAARRDRPALLARLAVVGSWLASFGTCYAFFLRHLGMNDFLLRYWDGTFLPLPPTSPGDVAWVVERYLEFFQNPGGMNPVAFGAGGLAAFCFLVAALALGRGDWRTLVALVGPLALAMLASGLKKYPFANRLLLFAVPAAVLMVGYGAWLVSDRLGRGVRGAGAVLLAMLFVGPLAECYWNLSSPPHVEDAREVIAHAHAGYRPGDKVYVYYAAVPAFAYYQDRHPFPPADVVLGVENRGKDFRRFLVEVAPFDGERRVWVVLAHRQASEEAAIMGYLDSMGRREEYRKLRDATVMRYDLSAAPVGPDPR